MTNEIKHTEESAGSRVITVAIFVTIIVFLVWLAVQAVGLVPNAFTSLASLADSIYNKPEDKEIVLLNNNAVINHGEAAVVNWADIGLAGNYYFSYECTDGVSIDIAYPADTIRTLTCGEEIDLGNSTELALLAQSAQKRFVEVPYSVVFISTNDELAAVDGRLTVMNRDIPTSQDLDNEGMVAGDNTDEDSEIIEDEDETVVVTPEVPTTPTRPVTPPPPIYVEVPIYAIPVSDPNGSVDLAVEIIGVGYMTSGNAFVVASTIDKDQNGAVRFKITNLGTKTSDDFTFIAELPNGQTYRSGAQDGLKPNEHSTLTIGFGDIEETGRSEFNVSVDVDDDINTRNNAFKSSVVVTN